ncbi:major facilitator superfamily domain-containing protein [Naematelia encephala]|uniref:Major facilitator superfamily domain-containing protein n=1 Tax=Naematelia encephala TaxID=71784 RepID=A0A1Y2BHH6_9TREE|nr:major facilitator superfamily domain-containing protein [Naematelia encephala]
MSSRRSSITRYDTLPGSSLHQRVSSPLPAETGPSPTWTGAYTPLPTSPRIQPIVPSRQHEPPGPSARPETTPLPYAKLFPLVISRMSEGLIYAVIFPYINEMVRSFGVADNKVGVWSAAAESALMVTEACCAPLYAPIADRLGRRPIILVLIFLFGVCAIAFGFVKDVWSAVIVRACIGLLAGCGVLSRTMLAELCDKSNRVQGFAVFSPALTVGVTIAPLIGGFLSEPVPRILPPSFTLFVRYPYLLPAMVSGSSGIFASVLGSFLLPETMPATLRRRPSRGEDGLEKHRQSGLRQLVSYAPFQDVIILYSLNNGVMFSWEAVYPLFAFTPKHLGGLGMSPQEIGLVLALGAFLSIFMTIFIFPLLHRSIPENQYLRLCLSAYPVAVVFFPILWGINYAAEGRLPLLGWTILVVQMVFRRFGDFAATMLDSIVMDAIPGPEHLAMANSLTFSTAAIGRALGPFIISWIFSVSTTFASPYSLGRQIVWIIMALLSLPSIWLAFRLQDTSEGDSKESEETHELMRVREETSASVNDLSIPAL